ncbi:MAG: DNA polymerase domain-containing protein [Chloroflexota bacterium]
MISSPPAVDPAVLLFGSDDTPGIVSVSAGRDGIARVWRRVGSQVKQDTARFPNWFFLADKGLLDGLNPAALTRDDIATASGDVPGGLGIIELGGSGPFKWVVLTNRWADVEAHVLNRVGQRPTARTPGRLSNRSSLSALDGLTYARTPAEQYLSITGRTYFKGMAFDDTHRLQFDLETTGLDASTDRVFMIAVSDNQGFTAVLDNEGDPSENAERDLIQRLVELVRERDPDVLENHSIFNFDLPFLVRRCHTLGILLAIGRDGSTPTSYPDTIKVGERSDTFTRYVVEGREVIDTLHAVRRYGAIVRDMRQQGLKEAAKYFGFAKSDREYVPGAEIWTTFQRDPDRVRRYATDDVLEVQELSRVLMPTSFALSQMAPKPYERVATAGTGQGLIEPMLARAYLCQGWSMPSGLASGGSYAGARTDLFTSGVVEHVVKADVASLYPSIMLTYGIGPRTDELGAFLGLLKELTRLRLDHKAAARKATPGSRDLLEHEAASNAMKQLINSFYGSLGTSFALFADLNAAAEVTRRGREILTTMLLELERRGVLLIEADTDGVFFGVPATWTEADERQLIAEIGNALPGGIEIEHDGRYAKMYSYAEKNYILLSYDGSARLVGGSFRSSKSERYGEQFLRDAAPLLLAGEFGELRDLYRQTIGRLRAREVPVDDVCVSIVLSKTPATYKKSGRREEQYEVLLGDGQTTWKTGDRVRYYQAEGKRKKLAERFDNDYDPEYYVKKLRQTYCKRLNKALTPEDFDALFGQEGTQNGGLFGDGLEGMQLLTTRERTPTAF